ncbi:hypothetical protein BXZ70DRAFT_594211 [Cristinia sonorae]|uniref:Uncharacterized protein n=1 Tax=Cristinia sonorae TaxID=1940300 RepID=A0A8K0UWL2_9AGAR|nr:hypothetical protein BXZ70DRAFT_594211 [Cristinia sonorae]
MGKADERTSANTMPQLRGTPSKPPVPRFALITPSASPPVSRSASKRPQPPPTKRPRLSSTPARSSPSLSRSTPQNLALLDEQGLHEARRASSQRVLSIWDSLAERYAKDLDEDDIVDLRTGLLLKDRGVMRAKPKIPIGFFAGDDPEQDDAAGTEAETETTEEDADTDVDPLDAFAPEHEEAGGFGLKAIVEKVPPVQEMDPRDAEDLRAFLEAEKLRKERCGAEGEEEDFDDADEGNARGVLASDDWATTDGEDLGSDDGDSSSEDPLLERVRHVTAEPALTLADDTDSEDELLAWSGDERILARATPSAARTPSPTVDIIDLTTPSPPRATTKREQSTSRPRQHSSSRGPPAHETTRPATPPRSPSPVQLHTPPRSKSQSSPPIPNINDPSFTLPSPPPLVMSKPTPRSRPKPTPIVKQPSPVAASTPCTPTKSSSRSDLNLTHLTQAGRPKTPSIGSTGLVVEVVLPKRSASRARSTGPKVASEAAAPPSAADESLRPSTPRLDKGKAKDLTVTKVKPEPKKAPVVEDSPSPPRPERWKPRFPRPRPGPSTPSTNVNVAKRKRPVSSSSSSSAASPARSSSSSPSPPLAEQLNAKRLLTKTPSKPKPKVSSAAKVKLTSPARKSDSKLHDKSRQLSKKPSLPSSPSTSKNAHLYPYTIPYTPHRSGDQGQQPGSHHQYPPAPPIFPVHDPQAQYYLAHTMHHLSYLMSTGMLAPPPPDYVPPPFPLPYQQQPRTPQHRHRADVSSSPMAGASSSRKPPLFATPTHHQPYPFTFDPGYSSGTLPPSSPPPSSPSSPSEPVLERRSALATGRSRSRGRRVSFKLDSGERPQLLGNADEEEEEEEANSSMRTIHMASPSPEPCRTRGRSESRGRDVSSSPTKGKGGRSRRIAVAEEPARGRTPGPLE